ncbi:MAG TPA: LamG domain-containing protein [Candidatus Methylacidiphilales bacterium]
MKTPFALGFGLFLAFAAGAPAQSAPLLCYEFNGGSKPESTDAAGSGGNLTEARMKGADGKPAPLWSSDAEGVTGQPGDYALDLRGATGMGGDGAGGVAYVLHPLLEGLKSFTLTGWIKTASLPGRGARLFDYAGPKAGFLLSFDAGKPGLQVNDKGLRSERLEFAPAAGWTFFAVTYDSTVETDNVVFYRGARGSGTLDSEVRTLAHPEPPAANPTGTLAIGNWMAGTRPLQGLLDKMAVYGSNQDGSGALKADEIQALFASVSAPAATASTP